MNTTEEFTRQLHQLAVKFRTNDDLSAAMDMSNILQEIMSDHGVLMSSNSNVIGTILAMIKECQTRDDHLGLADYLDYDLVRAITPVRLNKIQGTEHI